MVQDLAIQLPVWVVLPVLLLVLVGAWTLVKVMLLALRGTVAAWFSAIILRKSVGRGGGTGRRIGLKIRRSQKDRVGSIPAPGTSNTSQMWDHPGCSRDTPSPF